MIPRRPKTSMADAPQPKPSLAKRIRNHITRYIRNEDGTAAVEFAICIPVIMAIFMASMESGMLITRVVMLEQSVDRVMRNLRLGQYPGVDVAMLKREICDRTVILRECESNIAIEMMPISTTTWNLPTSSTSCVDRSATVQPALTFNPGSAHEIMVVRVCVAQDAMFPTTGVGLKLPKDAGGAYGLVAISAFVNEP